MRLICPVCKKVNPSTRKMCMYCEKDMTGATLATDEVPDYLKGKRKTFPWRGIVLVILALGAVAPTPIRARKAEATLRGKKLDDNIIEKAAQTAAGEARPIDDHRASAEYHRDMVEVLVKRAIKQAIGSRS